MDKILTVTPISIREEILTVLRTYKDPPVLGINGYWDDDQVIPMFDFDDINLRDKVINDHDIYFNSPSLLMNTQKGFHLINFRPIEFKWFLNIGLELGADRKHLGYSMIKGYPSLRVGRKFRSYLTHDINLDCIIYPKEPNYVDEVSVLHIIDYMTFLIDDDDFNNYMTEIKKYKLINYSGKVPTVVVYR